MLKQKLCKKKKKKKTTNLHILCYIFLLFQMQSIGQDMLGVQMLSGQACCMISLALELRG